MNDEKKGFATFASLRRCTDKTPKMDKLVENLAGLIATAMGHKVTEDDREHARAMIEAHEIRIDE